MMDLFSSDGQTTRNSFSSDDLKVKYSEGDRSSLLMRSRSIGMSLNSSCDSTLMGFSSSEGHTTRSSFYSDDPKVKFSDGDKLLSEVCSFIKKINNIISKTQ